MKWKKWKMKPLKCLRYLVFNSNTDRQEEGRDVNTVKVIEEGKREDLFLLIFVFVKDRIKNLYI